MTTITKNRSTFILCVLYFGWVVSYVDRTAITLALSSLGADLDLNPTQLGLVLSAFFLGYAAMQIPGGWLSDRFGTVRILIIAVIFWSIFTAASGLAWSLTSLIIIRFLFGIGEGGYPAASTKAIATYFEKSQRTKAQATMMSSNMIGAALAPIICAPLLLLFGWRTVFFIISVLGIFFVIGLFIATRNAKTFSIEDQNAPKGSFKELFKNPYLVKVLCIFFFVNIASWGLSSWMPTFLMEVHNIDMKSIGLIAAIPAVCSGIGMIVSGRIITKLGDRSKYGVVLGTAVLAICLFLHQLQSFLFINVSRLCLYLSLFHLFSPHLTA